MTRQKFDSRAFEETFYFDGPLGALTGGGGTLFRLWAPTAQSVTLRLYERGDGGEPFAVLPMARGERGVWSHRSAAKRDGAYYDYAVTVDGKTRVTADPYARACGLNGARSMVLDPKTASPDGWDSDRPPARGAEDIIYELHVREFSWQEGAGFPGHLRGKYGALCCADTCLGGNAAKPTGVGYLRRLGVTHVQLMPVYDYGSVDEAHPDDSFNWGYDPVNYNVPEGSYSTDPARGEVRVRELKEAVQALHRAGFRVIMDVVYNHTYRRDSWLERAVPGYYYRHWPDGSASDGSGCGNDLASERPMCARYILDSVLYWAEEYHMDGFRFDLMGLLDTKLMTRIRAALDERYGKGEKLVFGEPWTCGATAMARGAAPADKRAFASLDENNGASCDGVRDAVKGSVQKCEAPGFVNGGSGKEKAILASLTAWCGAKGQFSPKAPSQVVTYLSCHDDLTLWDKLAATMANGSDAAYDAPDPAMLRANRLAAVVAFTCQGRLFLLSGEEFARTKRGIGDAYHAPIEYNRLDWRRAWEFCDLADYYRGLIALRKQLPALCDKTAAAPSRLLFSAAVAPRCVMALWENGGRWKQVLAVYNASGRRRKMPLGSDGWEVLADGENSFLWQSPHPVSMIDVPPVSALILGRR